MPPLYVVEQGAKIRKEGRRLVVTKDEEILNSIPLIKVSQVLIFGNVGLTTPALTWLMSKDIDITFLTHDGRYRGRVIGQTSAHSKLRRLQYRRADTVTFAVNTARAIVRAKLKNSRTLLMRYQRRHNNETLQQPIDRLAALLDQADRAHTVNSLRGLEGVGAAVYFEAFTRLFKHNVWHFNKRTRRPPTDPVNVLLSFGYTLLAHQMEAVVELVGLDPFEGFLHATSYNRPSLALDLVEEFRAVIVDSVVLRCLNTELITPANFTKQADADRPILLDDDGRNRFIREFESRLALQFTHPARHKKVTWRHCFELQARDMARAIQSDSQYQPFVVR